MNGIAFYTSQKESPTRLAWYPALAAISQAGDLGFTTGPWDFARDKAAAPSMWGQYLSIWRKQADGKYKVAVDLGTPHRAFAAPVDSTVRVIALDAPGWSGSKADIAAARTAVLARDRAVGGPDPMTVTTSYVATAAEDFRLIRQGHFPVEVDSLEAYLTRGGNGMVSAPDTVAVAASCDLAYTLGTAEFRSPAGGRTESGGYARIWARESKEWMLVLEVLVSYGPGTGGRQ